MRRGLRTACLTAITLVLVLTTARVEARTDVARDVPDAGLPGIGDPYYPGYGNGGYDALAYRIAVDYNVRTRRLTGDTVVTATATQGLSRFNLDLRLPVTAVSVDGRPATFRQAGRELEITPPAPLVAGQQFETRVRYAGKPGIDPHSGLGWIATRGGAVAAGEPEVATEWFPSNDHPADKAGYDIVVTTRPATDVVSNGTLVSHARTRRSATWHWRETSPMVTYAALLAIGDYGFRRGVSPGGVPYQFAVSRNLPARVQDNARESLAVTPAAVDVFSRTFGRYPFDLVGGVATDSPIPIAIETQTKPMYGNVFARPDRVVVVHELAHQWFGDSVSVAHWRDIWLNEGFATWAEWLFAERMSGRSANLSFAKTFREYRGDPDVWGTRLVRPDPKFLFGPDVYFRGAMAVQALRNLIGPADFAKLVRQWVARHRHGNASTADFVALAEDVSGADLGRWYRVWLNRPAAPAVAVANGFPAAMVRARR